MFTTQEAAASIKRFFAWALAIDRTFDAKGRLIQLNEDFQFTKFRYDSTDLLIEKTDYLG